MSPPPYPALGPTREPMVSWMLPQTYIHPFQGGRLLLPCSWHGDSAAPKFRERSRGQSQLPGFLFSPRYPTLSAERLGTRLITSSPQSLGHTYLGFISQLGKPFCRVQDFPDGKSLTAEGSIANWGCGLWYPMLVPPNSVPDPGSFLACPPRRFLCDLSLCLSLSCHLHRVGLSKSRTAELGRS